MKFLQTLFIFFLVSVAQASTLIWDRTEARVAMKPEQAVAKAEYTLTNNSDAPSGYQRSAVPAAVLAQ